MNTIIIDIFLVLWLAIISIVLIRIRGNFSSFYSKTKKKTVDEALKVLARREEIHSGELKELSIKLKDLVKNSTLHYQMIGFVRFNPFGRVGGDQSFVVALLDGQKNGIVLNFMYAREGIRVFAKSIVEGKGKDQKLSAEEKKAIEKAS